jgi:FkbM family methyltransferase
MLQECFALAWNEPLPGTFVEVGAAGPEFLSNTLVLQATYGWRGLLVEPNPEFVRGLASRVNESVSVAEVAAGSRGNVDLVVAGELSCAVDMLPDDAAQQSRKNAIRDFGVIRVSRVPLDELLLDHFPGQSTIGFLSVDVEGAEQDVLDSIDWKRWSFNAIAVEHNYRVSFEKQCDEALRDRGYRRVLARISGWDAWYVPIRP